MDWSQYKVELAQTGRIRCEPGWRLDAAWYRQLADYDLWFVWAGRGRMTLRSGQTLDLQPGVCLWMRPGGIYNATQDLNDRLGVSYTHFDVRHIRTGRRPTTAELPAEAHEVPDPTYAETLLRRVSNLLWHDAYSPDTANPAPSARTIAEQLATGFLMDLEAGMRALPTAGTARYHEQLVYHLANRIRERPGEADSVETLAKEVGYTPDHLTRVFRQVLDISPQALIIRERISRARHLLINSSMNIQQIADVLGYSSVYFFSRQFKQKTGQTPTQYRRAITTTHSRQT